MSKEYYKSLDGLVHVAHPIIPEISLCGDAPEGGDGYGAGPDAFHSKQPKRGPVTCPDCCRMIEELKGYHLRPSTEQA